ncbi:MAG: hypothetical protein R3C09_16455 [Pirellulaceae bacterium]
MAGLVGMLWAAGAATESLWLDELHTSWVVAGPWSDVASRARQGNQSPLFFWVLGGLTKTLGNLGGVPGELTLRLPSIVCWGVSLAVCLREARRRDCGWIAAVAILVWMVLDRIQLFYATEARVYASVQLVSLMGWIAVSRIGEKIEINAKRSDAARCIWLWCGLSILLVFLHITAVLAVGWQIVCGTWIVVRSAPQQGVHWGAAVSIEDSRRGASSHIKQQRVSWCIAVSAVVVAVAIALLGSAQVWQHRQQWASFAGETTLLSLIGLFPLAAYAVPVAVARGVDWLWHQLPACGPKTAGWKLTPRSKAGSRQGCSRQGGSRHRRGASGHITGGATHAWIWWLAAAGPWLSAWCITAMGIAPIFHRRFVIVAAVPLIMLSALELSRVRRPGLRWSAMLAVAVCLIISQGSLDNWRAGQLFGWQRSEGWRQASQFLSERMQSTDQLWCASGLIEGHAAELPLSESLDRYLSFPLRGLYRVVDNKGEVIEPRALVGDGTSWAVQLRAAGRAASSESVVWIVYRGSPAAFDKNLRRLSLQLDADTVEPTQIGSPRAFGLVSVVRLSRLLR